MAVPWMSVMKGFLLKVSYLLRQGVQEGLYFYINISAGKSSTKYLNSDSTWKAVIGTGLQFFIDLFS